MAAIELKQTDRLDALLQAQRGAKRGDVDFEDMTCGGFSIFSMHGFQCLMELIRNHPDTYRADRLTLQQAYNVVEAEDSIAAVCKIPSSS